MNRDHDARPRQPMIEPLEPRQLLAAATGPLPDLKAELVYTPPAFVRPGGTVAAKLKVTNLGAAMPKKIKMPINFYVAKSPTLPAGTEPFRQIKSENIQLARNASGTYNVSAQIPRDVSAGTYYLFVSLNGNGKVLKEKSLANNVAVSTPIRSPYGTYSGAFEGRDGLKGNVALKLSSVASGNGVLADFTLRTPATTFQVEGIRAGLKRSGKFTLSVRGSTVHPQLGRLRYRIDMDGTITGKTYTGDARVVWHATLDSRNTWDQSLTLKRA